MQQYLLTEDQKGYIQLVKDFFTKEVLPIRGSICFNPPYRLPIPAAMITNTGLSIHISSINSCNPNFIISNAEFITTSIVSFPPNGNK